MNLSNDDVQDILRLLDSLPYTELTLETSRFTLQLRRSADGGWTQETQVLAQPALADPALTDPALADPALADPARPEPAAVPADPAVRPAGPAVRPAPAVEPAPSSASSFDADLRDVVTPLPGTFYRAPQPGAPPFVEAGGRVEPGTVVAIVETMKLMNPVYAGTAGTVTEICLDDGQFAEQGTVLMRIAG